MKFYKNFTTFQKGFFLVFLVTSLIAFFMPAFLPNGSLSGVLTTLGVIGLISTLSGVLVSLYTAKASISGYIWWWINTVSFGIICVVDSLYGQFIQNIFILLPLQIYGFIAWKKNMSKNNSDEIAIKKFSKKKWIVALILVFICWILYGYFLLELPAIMKTLFDIKISADPDIILDSFTSVLTITAVFLTGKRFIEQWHFWLVSNSLGIIMFVIETVNAGIANPSVFVADLSNTISLLQYMVGAIYGFYLWKKLYKERAGKYVG